jgi:hypothetical protein
MAISRCIYLIGKAFTQTILIRYERFNISHK